MIIDRKKVTIHTGSCLIGKAVFYSLFLELFIVKAIIVILWIAGFWSISVIVAEYFNLLRFSRIEYGLAYIVFGLFLFYLLVRSFYKNKLLYPKPVSIGEAKEIIKQGGGFNLYKIFSFELAKIWYKYIGSNWQKCGAGDILIALSYSKDINFILNRIGLSKDQYLKIANGVRDQVDLLDYLLRAVQIAETESHHQIEIGDLFAAICEMQPQVRKIFEELGLDLIDILNIVYWQTGVIRNSIKNKKFFDPDDLHLTGGIGRDWIYGYANMMQKYSFDLTEALMKHGLQLELVGHDREIKSMEEALTRQNGGNVLLVGEAGIGKKTTVLGFAKRVLEGSALGVLKNKHLVEIDVDAILSNATSNGGVTQIVSSLFNEAERAGNLIIFINNITNLMSSGDAGKTNATEVLIPYLQSSGVYIIGTCDPASYNKYISTNGTLTQYLTKIDIEEPNNKEMVRILEDVVPSIEYHNNSLITYQAIKETIKSADKYMLNIPNPEKSINLLDGAVAKATNERGQTIITSSDIDLYVAEKFDIPSSEINKQEKEKLLGLEETMHQRVIGQVQAINAIANAMRRSRAQISDSKKPIGSFLFLGPTGVGKTETAKALAEAYFGDENRMIRFDMSEYQNKQDIYRLIGSNISGEEQPGMLTTAIKEKPFSLLLIDEIEKAHPDILNLFLQVLDEGHLTDGGGRKVSFSNAIIIATSNAGANLIRKSINIGVLYEKIRQELLNYLQENNIYRPEFLNRFTQVIIFSPLDQEEIAEVAELMIKKLQKDIKQNKGIDLAVMPDAVAKLAKDGFDMQMGARPMARVIQDRLENMLAKKLLSGEIKKGDKIIIGYKDI